MPYIRPSLWLADALLLTPRHASAQAPVADPAVNRFSAFVTQIAGLSTSNSAIERRTLSFQLRVTRSTGLPGSLDGFTATCALQIPDRFRVSTSIENTKVTIGRSGQELWVYTPDQGFGVVGKPGAPRFSTAPEKLDTTQLPDLALPVKPAQLLLLPLLVNIQGQGQTSVDDVSCLQVRVTPLPQASESLGLPPGTFTLWLRDTDALPVRIAYREGEEIDAQIDLLQLRLGPASETGPAFWTLPKQDGDHIETTALGHLVRFASVLQSTLTQTLPTLGPATGERIVLAREGAGRLERINGTRVLFLQGSPEQMGRQHGLLLKESIRDLVDRILYGVGVGSSFEKGRWFFGEIEEAQARLQPFMNPLYLAEMDALAQAADLDIEEARLANYFPELFHCSGFALFGQTTTDGRLYHGRILDYLRGLGLEQNAVVIVHQPDYGHAWANISYAGFVGSVTAMNEQKISIGEMGGRGEGSWDGKPMAQLMREVMEQADTLDEAVAIMRRGPRTCEYYYVIADGKTKQAVGIAATADTFETVQPGEAHPLLPHPVKDAVLLSAGDRYQELVRRVQAQHGQIGVQEARDLMTRPVAMNSNIHSVLFAPETLDFWVANADSDNVASHTRYTQYNLGELLQPKESGSNR